jgi:hypothetical protein
MSLYVVRDNLGRDQYYTEYLTKIPYNEHPKDWYVVNLKTYKTYMMHELIDDADYYDEMTKRYLNSRAEAENKMSEPIDLSFNGTTNDDLEQAITEVLKDNNPKTAVALSKPRISDVPPVALFALGAAMSDGADKYGRYNWRDTSVTASVFYDAMMRHLTDWFNGENYAHDSKVNHLGHIMASCAILLDAEIHNVFNDDRDKRNPESIARNKHLWMNTNEN